MLLPLLLVLWTVLLLFMPLGMVLPLVVVAVALALVVTGAECGRSCRERAALLDTGAIEELREEGPAMPLLVKRREERKNIYEHGMDASVLREEGWGWVLFTEGKRL